MIKKINLARPLIILFVIINTACFFFKPFLSKWGFDYIVLFIANLLFFLLSLVAFYLQNRGVHHSNPNVFVRAVMGGMMIKMFFVIVAMMLYAFAWKEHFNKESVMAAMLLYFIYLVVEVMLASKMNKQKNA